MIVPTMTLEEIQREIDKDFEFIGKNVIELNRKYSRIIKNVRQFPFEYYVEAKSSKSNICYRFVFYANNKYKLKNPNFFTYTKYTHKGGTSFVYIRIPQVQHSDIEIFTPHFLKRYNERMHFTEQYTPEELFLRYWRVNAFSNEVDGILVDDTERYYHDDNTEYFGEVVQDGLVVCERNKSVKNIEVRNTFISPELFFESQEEKAKGAYILCLWKGFSNGYPPQREKLDEMFSQWLEEELTWEELLNRVNNFIANY